MTVWPFPSSRKTISLPITPSPTNPKLAITFFLRAANRCHWKFPGVSCLAGILAHLPKMSAHRVTGSLRIAVLDRFQYPLVVILAALRSAFDVVGAHALLPQQPDNGIDQRKNERIASGFSECQMEIQVAFNESFGIQAGSVHD